MNNVVGICNSSTFILQTKRMFEDYCRRTENIIKNLKCEMKTKCSCTNFNSNNNLNIWHKNYNQHKNISNMHPIFITPHLGYLYTKFIPKINSNKKSNKTTLQCNQRRQVLLYHRLGDSYKNDIIVVEFPENPNWIFKSVNVSNCRKYLILTISSPEYKGKNNLYMVRLDQIKDITKKFNLIQIVCKWDAEYIFITNMKSKAIFLTDKRAPNRRLIVVDLNNKDPKCHCGWRVLIRENKNYLNSVEIVNSDTLILEYNHSERKKFKVISLLAYNFLNKEDKFQSCQSRKVLNSPRRKNGSNIVNSSNRSNNNNSSSSSSGIGTSSETRSTIPIRSRTSTIVTANSILNRDISSSNGHTSSLFEDD